MYGFSYHYYMIFKKNINIYTYCFDTTLLNKQIAFVAISVFQPCNSFYFTIFEIYKMERF